MPENPEDLSPNLKALYDCINESEEKGIGLDQIFLRIKKDPSIPEILIDVMDDLYRLGELGYIERKFIQKKSERMCMTEIRWFAAGKGDNIESCSDPGAFFPF